MSGEGTATGAPAVVGPIGVAVAVWRVRRGLSRARLAERSGLQPRLVEGVETGRDWVVRRRVLVALASALRVDPGELAGQPYPPTGSEHVEVRAIAHRLRRVLAALPQVTAVPSAEVLDEVERLLAAATTAEGAGDEYVLAAIAPELIFSSERAVQGATGVARDGAAELRSRGHAVVAGLLRRLGYRDLAWLLLHRARAGDRQVAGPLLAEEMRLLLDLGLVEQALTHSQRSGRARRSVEQYTLEALAHAMADRPEQAVMELDAAAASARSPGSLSAVAAARVTIAVEAGDIDAATQYAAHVELTALAPAERSALLVALAVSAASATRPAEAAGHLALAETTAPLRLRLDPFARELLVALPPRIDDRELFDQLRAAAGRAGL